MDAEEFKLLDTPAQRTTLKTAKSTHLHFGQHFLAAQLDRNVNVSGILRPACHCRTDQEETKEKSIGKGAI